LVLSYERLLVVRKRYEQLDFGMLLFCAGRAQVKVNSIGLVQ